MIKICLPVLFVLSSLTCFPQNNIDINYFLKQLYDISSLPAYEKNTYCAEVSTYDRTGLNNDGFNGTYSFTRRNTDSSLVIFEQKGPGVINRIWTPTPSTDTLDFYIDDSLHKAFSFNYTDLFSGKVYPFVAPLCSNNLGGYYCYLPIPFNKFCKIVIRAKQTRFHQIGYRLYDASTNIKSFALPFNEAAQQSLNKVETSWHDILQFIKNNSVINEFKKDISIQPGETITAFKLLNAGRIAGFEIIDRSGLQTFAKNIDLRITWDDEKTPAVYCPLADYFGYFFGKASMQGLMVGSDGSKHYSWFPMPFDKSAKIEFIYRNEKDNEALKEVSFSLLIYTQHKKRDTATEGKFYAAWNHENPVPTGKPYTMLNVKGKGHFVGVALQAQGLKPGMTLFFEGDDSTVIDGETRFHGTGSEDFFNGGWYALLDRWDDAMSLPLSGSLGYSTALSRTGGYRYCITDKMSFRTSFLQTMEHGPEHNLFPADYTSVSYYYCDRNNEQTEMPSYINTKIFQPDTLEFYPQLVPAVMDGSVSVHPKWDGPAQKLFYTISNESLIKFDLPGVPAGSYTIYLDYDKSDDGAMFSVWQRQTQISDWIETYSNGIEKKTMQHIGTINITALNHSLSFRFKTNNDRNKFALGKIVLVKNK